MGWLEAMPRSPPPHGMTPRARATAFNASSRGVWNCFRRCGGVGPEREEVLRYGARIATRRKRASQCDNGERGEWSLNTTRERHSAPSV